MNLDTKVGNIWGFREIALYFVDLFIYKIKKNLTNIENWSKAMQSLAGELHNVSMTKAREMYNGGTYFRASSETVYQRLYSPGEITKFLNKNSAPGKIKNFLEATAALLKALKIVKDTLEDLKKTIKGYEKVKAWSRRVRAKGNTSALPDDELKNKIKIGAERFQVLTEALSAVNSFSPPGFREYADFCLRTCQGSKLLFEKAEAYSERLTAIAEEMQKESHNSIIPPNNWGASTYAAQQERAVDIFSK
ncbi:MAG: hypothetical protein J6W00_02055 [Lentisphaeria bacterium]|nr:hypothetical protein [Lentisphaeria bacterium]